MPAPTRIDPLTGALLPGEWNRILSDEDARIHRYGRPATVVLVELDGLDRLVAVLGQEAGDRILPAVADSLTRHARGADHVARLGPGRFGVLLPETGEVEAVNYVERVRLVCELWLESGAIALRLAIGWASPAVDTSLSDAFNEAQERMFAELRRGARRDSGVEPNGSPPTTGLEGAASPA
jgi:diguanylate cyclase (GGDEF)-like protein